MFQRLAADLLPHVPSLTSGEVARCAKSFAFLKWLSLPLFEAFAQVSVPGPAWAPALHARELWRGEDAVAAAAPGRWRG